jgi:uncharacterized membrane protein
MDQSENSYVDFDISSFYFLDILQNVDHTFFIYIIIAIVIVLLLAYLFFYNNYYNKEHVKDNIVNSNDINDIQRQVETNEGE